jgi:hypothetical protein
VVVAIGKGFPYAIDFGVAKRVPIGIQQVTRNGVQKDDADAIGKRTWNNTRMQ